MVEYEQILQAQRFILQPHVRSWVHILWKFRCHSLNGVIGQGIARTMSPFGDEAKESYFSVHF